MNMTDPHHSVTGILVVDKNPLLVASQPVIHSDFSGTPDGVVIVGRYISMKTNWRVLEVLPVRQSGYLCRRSCHFTLIVVTDKG